MPSWVEKLSTGLLTIAAVAIAGVLVRREFFASSSTAPQRHAPQYVEAWRDALGAGVILGNRNAPVTIVEFMDLECPFCKTFNSLSRSLKEKHGDKIAFVVVHYPLDGLHRFARPAANAVECAGEQRRFAPMFNSIYEKQDSLGLKSWVSFAREAGVADTVAYATCLSRPTPSPRIEAGVAMARRFGVEGTPTLIINGWLLKTPPGESELNRAVDAFLAGKSPFSS